MNKRIHSGFTVQTGGVQSLRVVTADFLRKVGAPGQFTANTYAAQFSRFGGKKLKLYDVDVNGGVDLYHAYRFWMGPGRSDTFTWYPWMFQEYWVNGAPELDKATTPAPVVKKPSTAKATQASPTKKDNGMGKLLKMVLLMNLLNGKKE